MKLNLGKPVLALLLIVIGLFSAGCGCSGGECPFKKIFGSKSESSKTTESAPADAGTK